MQKSALERDVERTRAAREARWHSHVPAPKHEKREPTPEELSAEKEKQAEAGRLAAEKRWADHETPDEPVKRVRERKSLADRKNGVLAKQIAIESAWSRPERIREMERKLRLYPGEPTRYADVFSSDTVRLDDLGASEPLCDTMALDDPESVYGTT